MNRTTLGTALGGALITTALLAAPAAATAAPGPAPAEGTAEGQTCTVTESELTWGFKESFRSYISGSIANGEWTTENGAEYETPNFIWSNGEGSVASTLDEGTIEFTGSINFSGHDGALSIDVENPAIEFAPNNAAYLLLGFGATDAAQEEDVESSLLQVAKIETEDALSTEGDQITLTDATVRLTAEGAEALNGGRGGYAAGDEMDPINLSATVAGCELGATATPAEEEPDAQPEETTELIAPEPAESEIPWVPIIVGAVALLVIGVTAGMLVAGRKGKNTPTQGGEDPTAP